MNQPTKTEKFLSLNNIEQVQITRSFSRKIQLEQYQPIEMFASVQATLKAGLSEEQIIELSRGLQELAVAEVTRDIEGYYQLQKKPF